MVMLPPWLHKRCTNSRLTHAMVQQHGLHTVCDQAQCPNKQECFAQKRATFLLLGSQCTRACRFCAISTKERIQAPDVDEPMRVALCAKELGLRHVILTMVTRDDLTDGGAGHMAKALGMIHTILPDATSEVLVSDFQADTKAIDKVMTAGPDIFAHNVETVASLTPVIRSCATYERSLFVLSYVKKTYPAQKTKSGLMVGLGEKESEVCATIDDLAALDVDSITIGQYLQPTDRQIPVQQWVEPQLFAYYKQYAYNAGIPEVLSGPFVRSSSWTDSI